MSWRHLPRLNMQLFKSIPGIPLSYKPHHWKCDIHNQPHPCKSITQHVMASWTAKFQKTIQVNGHAFLLGDRSIQTKIIWRIFKFGVSNLTGFYTKNPSPAHHKVVIIVYLHSPNSGKATSRLFYFKSISNRNKGKPMPTVGYNNTKSQSGVRTGYVLIPGGVWIKPISIY